MTLINKNKIILDLQLACNNLKNIPDKSIFIRWIQHIFSHLNKTVELTIRMVNKEESRSLNMRFLKRNYPTNVLSFPFYSPTWIHTFLIGDIVICQDIIENESKINEISIETYTAYIVTHGALHLMGYNHITDEENKIMKNVEQNIMKKLGYITINFLQN